MTILTVEHLSKTYGDKVLFNDIGFTIQENERIGLIGVNGTGKSTLLKVLAGTESREGATLTHANDFRVDYLPQHPELSGSQSVLDHVYEGDAPIMKVMREYERALKALEKDPNNEARQTAFTNVQQKMNELDAWEASTVAKTVLTKLGIEDMDAKLDSLSGGQQKRVAMARALLQPADLLLLDEPTNHLDHETIEWLEKYLSTYQGSLILITHDRYFLNRVTNRIYELDNGNLYTYDGNYETFLQKKAEREAQEVRAEEKRQNLLRTELEWLRRDPKARGTKQKARVQRAEELKSQKGPREKQSIDVAVGGSNRLGKQVIEVEDVSHTYDHEPIIKDFSYLITPNERLGLVGPNGSGKSTFLNILAGYLSPEEGAVHIGQTVKIGYYTQQYEDMDIDLRVVEFIKEVAEVVYTIDGQEVTAEQMLERFLFPRPMQWTYIRRLSGGERRRLYLLKILMEEPNVLLLDEPTNDLDTQTLRVLEDYLASFPGVVITASHDRYFLDRATDRLLVFEGEGEVRRFEGSYSEWLEKKQQEQQQQKLSRDEQTSEPKKQQTERPPKKKKLSYREQKEWNEIEDRISDLEEKQEEIEKELAEAGSNYDKIQDLYEQKTAVDNELDDALERWTILSEKLEEIENQNE
ncbi:ABC-F family ATP-binding cassette domain-containing protein [Texcoconibacillus texcoconensis]|uniref:ATP-binding cassette subfamily F protein uup n=1 Tax=Texcoconibacillus texcoconensis TaxID=1095777 RepID=A0A840QLQ1_9BACI|nr:ABC-F family ATP-binding cassette domain-containing protein [Texcoconibacillus texcoconensis]MBB5172299.1 ATP-binding cassette subfamily F protein uup [Texcoconibacillus texcoconensis]